jgi:hypothetical protein
MISEKVMELAEFFGALGDKIWDFLLTESGFYV